MATEAVIQEGQTLAQKIRSRQKQLEEIRRPWESEWEKAAELVQPRREGFTQYWSEAERGKRKGTLIYDGTPGSALLMLADGLMGYLVSPSMQWFRLIFEIQDLMDLPGAKIWLQETAEALYSAFHRSNFYGQMHEYFLDGGSVGTASIYSEENVMYRKIVFSTLHPAEIFIAENMFGEVDTVHRRFKISAREAVKKFNESKLSLEIRQASKHEPDKKFEFLHAVFPNEDRMYGKLNSANKRFSSVYMEYSGEDIIQKAGYDDLPYAVWRWRKNSNEWYGRSPALDAMVEILGLNRFSEDVYTASHMAVKPPYNIPEEMRKRLQLYPGGHNFYDKEKRIISPINTNIQYPIAVDFINKKEEIIRKHFRVDFFLMLAEAQRQMTATEIMERQSEKAAVLGATIGRLQSDCLNPIIDRIYSIEKAAGRLPEVPESLIEYAGENIRVDYLGPLAQAQKRLYKASGVMGTLEKLAVIAKFKPEILDDFDWDVIAREIAESHSFPQEAILDPRIVERIREAKARAMQEQQRLEQVKQVAEMVPKLRQKTEKGSPLEALEAAGAGAGAAG